LDTLNELKWPKTVHFADLVVVQIAATIDRDDLDCGWLAIGWFGRQTLDRNPDFPQTEHHAAHIGRF
jgi:hypothetical protein